MLQNKILIRIAIALYIIYTLKKIHIVCIRKYVIKQQNEILINVRNKIRIIQQMNKKLKEEYC